MDTAIRRFKGGRPLRALIRQMSRQGFPPHWRTPLEDRIRKCFAPPLGPDLLTILDFDPSILSFYDRPVTIEYSEGSGAARRYTPDILIRFTRDWWPACTKRPLLADVMTKRDLAERNDAGFAERLRAAQEYCTAKKWEFRVLTEDQIRTPYVANARFLREQPKRELEPGLHRYLVMQRERIGTSTVGELLAHCIEDLGTGHPFLVPGTSEDPQGQSGLLAAIWQLVADGFFVANFHNPLDLSSLITPSWMTPATCSRHTPAAQYPEHCSPLWL